MPISLKDLPDQPARAIIEGVQPEIDGGRFPAKRVVGESVVVEADIFAEGHDKLSAVLRYRAPDEDQWSEAWMTPLVNDRWRASFPVTRLGRYQYTLEAWVDPFKSWQADLKKRVHAGQDVTVDLQIGVQLLRQAAERAGGEAAGRLRHAADELSRQEHDSLAGRTHLATSAELLALMSRHADRAVATRYPRELEVVVDPVLARYGAWYELFPRSFGPTPDAHGTFKDCEAQLPRISRMGFDVLYLPPIHPIGRSFRKGKNNSPQAEEEDHGSPWGIGADEGGHTSVHPDLGSLEDFKRLVRTARDDFHIEIAMDIAFQCSPDHPWVKEHPEWFIQRPDGTIQYAENPPKKYQDIYPLNFESTDWKNLWEELKKVFVFWIEQGVKIFRVDNPHTKALPFWEWVITEIKHDHPEVILLSEAFTRPRVMYYLAKAGFTQSYNYFPWRNTRHEIERFMLEVTRPPVSDFFRPNLWPNTPDILPQYLQYGGRPGFMVRLILAATLGASYGIYGPAFELCDNQPREVGTEEYLHSEKYQLKNWNFDTPDNLTELITRVNRIRRENAALHTNDTLLFHPTDNPQVIAYSKHTADLQNILLMVINLDPHHTQMGWLNLEMEEQELGLAESFQVHELITGARFLWHGSRNYFELNPHFVPGQIFRIRRRIRTEQDFDYFM
jgi:starch synthase (maltosyl-transferring)